MAEVLTQEEIDSLLRKVSSGAASDDQQDTVADSVYLYDFKHPNRVSKDQLRSLRTIHEGFARMLGTYLTTLLRTIVDVHLLSIDQVTFLEFTMAMSNPGCIWIFDMVGDEGKGILEVSPDLVFLTIERLFGGEGKSSGETRAISVIEQNVAGKIIEKCMHIYDEAWKKAIPIQTKLNSFEMNPQFAQIAPASETAVVMFLEINIRNSAFPMNVCFPYFVLDPLIARLSMDNWLGLNKRPHPEEDRKSTESSLKGTEVPLIAYLGETSLTFEEVAELDVNDVILLDTKIEDMIKIKVKDETRFFGSVGVTQNKVSVQIHEVKKNIKMDKKLGGHSRRRVLKTGT